MTRHNETFWFSLPWRTAVFSLTICLCEYLTRVESQLILDLCQPIDKCSCKFDNGSVIDIAPVGWKSGGPRFGYEKSIDDNPDWEYAANICYGFNDHVCKNQVICQRTSTEPYEYFPLGNANEPIWMADGTGITYEESYEGTTRTSVLFLECDISGEQNKPTFIREGEITQEYKFTLRSICACAGGCKRSSSSGLSFGSILCIIFSVVVVVYLIGGMLFMKIGRGAEGKEVIPNVELWINLPGYIKDGFLFIIHGCKRPEYDGL